MLQTFSTDEVVSVKEGIAVVQQSSPSMLGSFDVDSIAKKVCVRDRILSEVNHSMQTCHTL